MNDIDKQNLNQYKKELEKLRDEAINNPLNKEALAQKQREWSAIYEVVFERAKKEPDLKQLTDNIFKIIKFFNE